MCRVLDVARAGYYAWLHKPLSDRAKEDARLLRLIRASYNASRGVYGSTRIFLDLREAGETCSKHRVARIMRANKIRALHGYGSDDWRRFCRTNRLEPSMSRRGNCWDNAVAESFFASLKKERIKKRIYNNRDQAIAEVSDYIDSFYIPVRRHRHLGGVSPEEFEARAKRA